MTPANPDALAFRDDLVRAISNGSFGKHYEAANAFMASHVAPLLAAKEAAEARAAQLQVEVEALKDERARRKAATQSVREKAAALCDEAAAYFDRTTGHYDRTQAAGGYRATASKIRLLTPDRTALAARAATASKGQTHTPASGALKIEEADRDA